LGFNDAAASVVETAALLSHEPAGQGLGINLTPLPPGIKYHIAAYIPYPEAFVRNFMQYVDSAQ